MRNVHPNLRKIKQSFSERSSKWTRYEEVIKFKEEKKSLLSSVFHSSSKRTLRPESLICYLFK